MEIEIENLTRDKGDDMNGIPIKEISNIYTVKNDIEESDNKITKNKIKNKMNNKFWKWKRIMLGYKARDKKSKRKRRNS